MKELIGGLLPRIRLALTLFPRQAVEAPTAQHAAVFVFVEGALEAFQDVDQMLVTGGFQGLGGIDRADAATAQQQDGGRFVRRVLLHLFDKACVELHAGKFLPGHMDCLGRMADEAVFDRGSDIDQHRGWVLLQQSPGLFGVEIFNHVLCRLDFLADVIGFVSIAESQIADAGVFPIIDKA